MGRAGNVITFDKDTKAALNGTKNSLSFVLGNNYKVTYKIFLIWNSQNMSSEILTA